LSKCGTKSQRKSLRISGIILKRNPGNQWATEPVKMRKNIRLGTINKNRERN